MRAVPWAWVCVGLVTGCGGNSETSAGATSGGGTTNASSNSSNNSQQSSTTSAGGSPATGGVRFVAFGDAGKGNQGQLDVAAAIAQKCAASGCDFVQLLGDNLYESGAGSPTDTIFQEKFEVPYENVDLPFWVVLGNHDYGGNGGGYEFNKGQNEIDYTEISDKWELPAAYYRRTVEHVEFFALDTNMAMFSMADEQEANFPTWVGESTATWKIGLGHHPYKSNGPHGNAGNYDGIPAPLPGSGGDVKGLLEAAVCGQVDVYLCGHDHSMQWLTEPCNGTELIVSGAGASTTDLPGNNDTLFESLSLGFLYVVIDGNTFTAEFIDTAGQVLFTRTITK